MTLNDLILIKLLEKRKKIEIKYCGKWAYKFGQLARPLLPTICPIFKDNVAPLISNTSLLKTQSYPDQELVCKVDTHNIGIFPQADGPDHCRQGWIAIISDCICIDRRTLMKQQLFHVLQ